MNKTGLGLGLIAATLSAIATASTPIPDTQPYSTGQYVVINIPQQRLFLYADGKLVKIYPVAVGKASTQTNLGRHLIGVKAYNPTWHIPKSIQKEMKSEQTSIPPGPNNPLGPVFVRLGDPKLGLGIHGTNAPSSVPGIRSHGCVRMKSPDALEFAKTISSGSPVDVIYQTASLNADANNNLWLAAFRDPYNQKNLDTKALQTSISAWAKAHGKTVNTKRVAMILANKTGISSCITCNAKNSKTPDMLKSLAWTSGLGELSKTVAPPPKPAPKTNQVLPEGSEIEIDADVPTNANPQMPSAPASASTEYNNEHPNPSVSDYEQEDNGTQNLF